MSGETDLDLLAAIQDSLINEARSTSAHVVSDAIEEITSLRAEVARLHRDPRTVWTCGCDPRPGWKS